MTRDAGFSCIFTLSDMSRRDRSRSRDRERGSRRDMTEEEIAAAARKALLTELTAEKQEEETERIIKSARANGVCISFLRGRCDKGDGKLFPALVRMKLYMTHHWLVAHHCRV